MIFLKICIEKYFPRFKSYYFLYLLLVFFANYFILINKWTNKYFFKPTNEWANKIFHSIAYERTSVPSLHYIQTITYGDFRFDWQYLFWFLMFLASRAVFQQWNEWKTIRENCPNIVRTLGSWSWISSQYIYRIWASFERKINFNEKLIQLTLRNLKSLIENISTGCFWFDEYSSEIFRYQWIFK